MKKNAIQRHLSLLRDSNPVVTLPSPSSIMFTFSILAATVQQKATSELTIFFNETFKVDNLPVCAKIIQKFFLKEKDNAEFRLSIIEAHLHMDSRLCLSPQSADKFRLHTFKWIPGSA